MKIILQFLRITQLAKIMLLVCLAFFSTAAFSQDTIVEEIFLIEGGELNSDDSATVMPTSWWVSEGYGSGRNNYDLDDLDESVAIMFKSNDSYLITPAVDKPGVLTFWGKHKAAVEGALLIVEKSVDGGDYVNIDSITTLGDEYAEFTVVINDFSSNVKIKFSSNSGDDVNDYKFYLDNIIITESTSPTVKAVFPADSATDVAINSNIVIEFYTSMNTISVENALSLSTDFSASTYEWSQVSTTLTISGNNMLNDTKYDVFIDSLAADITGLTLENDFASSFTTIEEVTGVTDFNTMLSSVYPNPVSDELSIKLNGEVESIEMISLLGKIVFSSNSFSNSDIVKIDVANFDKGVYLIRATNNGQQNIMKVVIE